MTEKDGTVYVNAALMRDGGQLNEPVLVRMGESGDETLTIC